MEVRLQKIISAAGIASRRAAEKLIEEGRVQVNGATVTELGTKADLGPTTFASTNAASSNRSGIDIFSSTSRAATSPRDRIPSTGRRFSIS